MAHRKVITEEVEAEAGRGPEPLNTPCSSCRTQKHIINVHWTNMKSSTYDVMTHGGAGEMTQGGEMQPPPVGSLEAGREGRG